MDKDDGMSVHGSQNEVDSEGSVESAGSAINPEGGGQKVILVIGGCGEVGDQVLDALVRCAYRVEVRRNQSALGEAISTLSSPIVGFHNARGGPAYRKNFRTGKPLRW